MKINEIQSLKKIYIKIVNYGEFFALCQGFSQRVSDTLISIFFVYNAKGLKGIGHPIHAKFSFLDTQLWNHG